MPAVRVVWVVYIKADIGLWRCQIRRNPIRLFMVILNSALPPLSLLNIQTCHLTTRNTLWYTSGKYFSYLDTTPLMSVSESRFWDRKYFSAFNLSVLSHTLSFLPSSLLSPCRHHDTLSPPSIPSNNISPPSLLPHYLALLLDLSHPTCLLSYLELSFLTLFILFWG